MYHFLFLSNDALVKHKKWQFGGPCDTSYTYYIYIAKQKYDKDKGNPWMTQWNRNFMIIECTG